MARNTDAIKECLRKSFLSRAFQKYIWLTAYGLWLMAHLEFKGPPDPLRGDEIYRRVREMAKVITPVF